MNSNVDAILSEYPAMEELAEETETMRDLVDSLRKDDTDDALQAMINIDTNMLQLMGYHVRLATACLNRFKETVDVEQLILTCAAISSSKGFDLTQHATQIALIATEVAEALDCLAGRSRSETFNYMLNLQIISKRFEEYRQEHKGDYTDDSIVADQRHLNEELADICIRVFSYVGGNGQGEAFVNALLDKMTKNMNRPHLHGKGF